MRRPTLVLALTAAVLTLAACGSSAGRPDEAPTSSPSPSGSGAAPTPSASGTPLAVSVAGKT